MVAAEYSVYFYDVYTGFILEKQRRKEQNRTVAKDIKQT